MTDVVVLAVVIIFFIGMISGVVLLVSVASRREDKRLRLSREAPDRMTNAARYLTSLYVRREGDWDGRQVPPEDQQAQVFGWPHLGPGGRAR
jgi:hypothetical protein